MHRWKANIICEELGIDYKVHPISLSKNEQKQDWFLKINPNGRIPAIGEHCRINFALVHGYLNDVYVKISDHIAVDHDEGDLPVFESGAVLIYLAEKYDKFLPKAPREKAEVISWLMWQMVGSLACSRALCLTVNDSSAFKYCHLYAATQCWVCTTVPVILLTSKKYTSVLLIACALGKA